MKKKLFVLCTICFMFLFSGCELFDVLNDAINNFWGGAQSVDVLILPPLPIFEEGEKSHWNERLANCDSKAIKEAMLRGVSAFNDGTKKTKIYPCYFVNKETVDSFYEEVVLRAIRKDSEERTDKNLRQAFGELLRMQNQDGKNGGAKFNFKCLICGFYKFNRNAPANKIQLFHYDTVKDGITVAIGVVTKEEGNVQDNDLAQLMTALLKKAYGK